jgi:hypothetical protein
MENLQARELRIGNLIGWYEPNQELLPVNVIGLSSQMIWASVNGTIQQHHENYQSWKPIPLNIEWLLKFEFIQCENDQWYELNIPKLGITISCNLHGRIAIEDYKNEMVTIRECCYYLHQLQNLLFALTSHEFILNV